MQTDIGLSGKLEALMDINKQIAGCLNERDVLKKSLKLETNLVDAETGSIMLLDESGDYLNFSVALGDSESVLEDHRVKVGEGIAGHVAQSREPVLIEDTQNDNRFSEYYDEQTGFETRSLLCVPIQVGDKLLGVAEVINKVDGTSFDHDDLILFSAFAGQVAVALENARLHEEVLAQERMRQEIKTARKVQQSYLSDHFPVVSELEFKADLQTAKQVAGDFYDVFELESGEVAFLLGDVSGKGMAAAMYMCRVLTELRTRLQHGHSPARVLKLVNERLCETSTRGMFVTLCMFVIHPDDDACEVANAGHLPFFELNDGNLTVHDRGSNPPLGISPGQRFDTFEFGYDRGTTILGLTDGVTEARNPNGEMYGLDRLEAGLSATVLPPKFMVDKVLLDVRQFTESEKQSDDVTVIAFGKTLERQRYSFEVGSHSSSLEFVRSVTTDLLTQAGVAEGDKNDVKVGVCEVLGNIIEHTYHNKKTGRIQVDLRLDESVFTGTFRDFGEPVDPDQLTANEPDPDNPTPGGLGLHLIENCFDEVNYDSDLDDGNRLTLTRELQCHD